MSSTPASSSTSKKEALISGATSFLDKLRKSSSSNSGTSGHSSSSGSTSSSASQSNSGVGNASNQSSNLISNLAISFHKNVLNSSKDKSTTSAGPTLLLNKTGGLNASNLIIINDDENIDDDNFQLTKTPIDSPTTSSASNLEIKSNSDNNNNSNISDINKSNASLDSSSSSSSSNSQPVNSANTSTEQKQANQSQTKLPTSSSLYKISSVLDDIFKSDVVSKNVSNVVDEAETLRRKLFVKKKSIESDNLKVNSNNNKVSSVASLSKTIAEDTLSQHSSVAEATSTTSAALNDQHPKHEQDSSVAPSDNSSFISPAESTNFQESISAELKANTDTSEPEIEPCIQNSLFERESSSRSKNSSYPVNFYAYILVPIFLAVLAYYLILPKWVSLTILAYSCGVSTGILLVTFIFFLLIKFDMLKYIKPFSSLINKNSGSATSVEANAQQMESSVNQQIKSLLIQTALIKENKSFDGVYKVCFSFKFVFFVNIQISLSLPF
jgi:hypothetical protein